MARNFYKHPFFVKGVFTGATLTAAIGLWGRVLDNYSRKRSTEKQKGQQVDHDKQHLIVNESKPTTTLGAFEDTAKLDRGREILKYGTPEVGRAVRYYSNHVLIYNQQTRTPIWVAEHLTKENLQGSANRRHAKFIPDPGVDTEFTAENSDYWKSGWSRGHMAPAGNNKINQEAMQDSFYLSNVVPQNYENNAGFWNRLEMYCRDLAKKYSNVYVISGPIMVPEKQEDGKKFVKYQVIGENHVAVPTHLYKVIIVEDKYGKPAAVSSFVVPNEPVGFEHHLKEFEVELFELEHVLGVKLVPNLKAESVKSLCKVDGCKLIGRQEFELYFIGRKLESANTLHRVEKVWSELEEKKLKPDRYLKNLYKNKIKELSEKEQAKVS
ncbi:nuclease EXOG, mitochondrial-like [Mercenaria mercenaria]|uniref:nuclease EXOG, mitochondrial-like n=1 Tax=Mercenaria mercenaria TaxID=6596 RepID=UPI00234F7053|nr:nuclease EXOG, mitochondrial-like [Mercenaria mercenaria]